MKLKNRHIQMIAIGGAIGTGLFFGAAKSIQLTGPSIILSYLIGGCVMYVVLRALGEMTVHEPNFGSFSHYAYKYVGNYCGFISGWYSWFEYTIVCMLEITAVTVFLDIWLPFVPHWISVSVLLLLFFGINIINVRVFGEFEFWFAGIKVATIVAMIIFALYLFLMNKPIHDSSIINVNNYFQTSLYAGGWYGFLCSLVLVVFSFGGSQFIGIAAADAEHPHITVPKAVRGVILRIVIFYIGTLTVILALYPWHKLSHNVSPFVDVFLKIGLTSAAQVMNLIAITAALSAFNSCLYSAARMLANLGRHHSAPSILGVVNKRGIPANALIATSVVIALTILINYLFPAQAIIYLIAIATTSIIVTWITIIISHIGFRLKNRAATLSYRLPLFPVLNILAIIFLLSVVAIMYSMPDMRLAVQLMPLWLGLLTVYFFILMLLRRMKLVANPAKLLSGNSDTKE